MIVFDTCQRCGQLMQYDTRHGRPEHPICNPCATTINSAIATRLVLETGSPVGNWSSMNEPTEGGR